jgi:hypothetical protein
VSTRTAERPARGRALTALLLALGCAASAPEPEAYAPGLGEIMTLTQMRHAKLWLAGEAGNWPLAAYELDELEERLADAVRFHPTHKSSPRPLTVLVPDFMDAPVRELRDAAERRDRTAFAAAYDALTTACNGCHDAAHFGFNVVVRPAGNPWPNQRFEPSRGADPR